MITFEGKKSVTEVSKGSIEVTEVRLPESTNVRKIYLKSKEEVDLAFSKGKRVFTEQVQTYDREYTRIYVNVPLNKLIEIAL